MLTKSKSGWYAKDVFDFNGKQKLSIRTRKSYDGTLTTRAQVAVHDRGMESHAIGLAAGGDWSLQLARTALRGTEKNIAAQQAAAVARLPELIELAKAHYLKFPYWAERSAV